MAKRAHSIASWHEGETQGRAGTALSRVPVDRQRLPGGRTVGPGAVASLIGRSDTQTRASIMLSLQRRVGNQAVQRVVQTAGSARAQPEPVSPALLPDLLAGPSGTAPWPGVVTTVAFAGPQPDAEAPPGGLAKIRALRNHTTGAGATRTFMYYADRKNLFRQGAPEKVGKKWRPNVLRARTQPPTFESYYPADGLHLVGKSRKGKQYVYISDKMAKLIKRGEQEHIDDGLEAYRVARQAIELAIEAVRNDTTLLAATESGARKRAEDALAKRLPKQLLPDDWTRDAQMRKWEGSGSVAQKMVNVSSQRDGLLSPHALSERSVPRADWRKKLPKGTTLSKGDTVQEVTLGKNTKIPGKGSDELIDTAFKQLPGGPNAPKGRP